MNVTLRKLTLWSTVLIHKLTADHLVQKFPTFEHNTQYTTYGTEGSLLCSQQPATDLYSG